MVVESVSETEYLVTLLDPERDYGERDYEKVVADVRAGILTISPGQRLPILFDPAKRQTVKGTGQPPQEGLSNQQRALAQFRGMAIDDVPAAYATLWAGMQRGDPRYDKIYWELLVGKMGESRGGEAIATAFKALIEAMQRPEERRVPIEQ